MQTPSYQMKHMLRTYGKQLISARRLVRMRRNLRIAGDDDRVTISREARRKSLVERVAKEIIDNLLVTGTENPIVDEIREELEQAFGTRLLFEYPFMEYDLQVFRETDDGPKRLTPEEKDDLLTTLWNITVSKVEDTML